MDMFHSLLRLRQTWRGLRLFTVFALLVAMLNVAQPAFAASITVTTTADVLDAAANCMAVTLASLPGPGGQTSLREAVCAANSNPGSDTISFSVNGTFALTGPANEDNGGTGDLDIKQSLAINGNGISNTIIDGSGTERIMDVFPAAASTFDISNLTLQNGDTRFASFQEGGAIYLHNNVTSTFNTVQIVNNFSGANGAVENRGTLTISNSTISNNQTLPSSGTTVGGGIRNAGALSITNSTISNNTVRGEGGGIATTTGIGVVASITNSTISGNTASVTGGGLGNGGGISTTGNEGTLNITNSTISGNRADNNGGGAYFVTPGGGTGTVNLNNVTVTNNTADNDNNGSGAGGGFAQNTSSVTLHNTIVAGNFNSTAATRDDISGTVAASSSYNLVGDGTGSVGITNGVNNNQVGSGASPVDPLLGPLANNTGPTLTHELLSGSPAINSANNATCAVTDQRGIARPVGGTCDKGSFELADLTPPDTTITSNPPNPSNSSTATFTFTGSDSGGSGLAGFQCRIDGGGFTPCTSPQTYLGLADGSHTFQVRAVDGLGNLDPTPASYTWSIDSSPPTVTINQDSGQADPTSDSPINFTVVFAEPVAGFTTGDVTLSGTAGATTAAVTGGPTTYTVAVSGMASGGTVIATIGANVASDAAGNGNTASTSTDNTVTFIADSTPPDTTITSNPSDPTNSASASFSFTGSDDQTAPGSLTFECQLDGGAFTPCTSPQNYSGLSEGSHTFQVRATDSIGNVDPTPASFTWTIDTTAPTVTINQDSGQADPTSTSPINFTVVFAEPVTGFTTGDVTLSGTAGATNAVVTGGPTTYNVAVSGMTSGGTVIATIGANVASDAAGNGNTASTSTDNTVTFIVDNIEPDTTITSNPSDPTNSTSASFSFTGVDDQTPSGSLTFECRLDGGAFTSCTSPQNYSGLGEGSHTFEVRAIDSVGNVDPTPASFTWVIDTTAPAVTIDQDSGQADPTSTSPIIFTVVFAEPVTGFDDSDVTLSGTAGATTAVVTGGPTTYTVTVSGMTSGGTVIATIGANVASDAAGNGNTASTSTDNSVTFILDNTPPETTITSNPTNPTTSTSASFSFTGSDDQTAPGSLAFECQLDGGAFTPCTSPQNYSGLSEGSHTFQVRATDSFGNVDPTPAAFAWTIDTTPPVTTASVSGTVKPGCPSDCFFNSATVTLSASDVTTGVAETRYRIDGGPWQTYTGPFVVTGEGSHVVEFYSTDQAGNVEATKSVTVKITSFPSTNVLDTFNRASGKVGSNWSGATNGDQYIINGQQVDVNKGGLMLWKPASFGASQEAYMTLSRIDTAGKHHTLALKARGTNASQGVILVSYDATQQRIVVEALKPGTGWFTVAVFSNIQLSDGAVLGARALADGTVKVYVNCTLVGTADTRPQLGNTYVNQGGSIGVWYENTSNALFDNYGGGNTVP